MYIAAEKYDRTKNIRYNTYARNWVSVMLWDYKRVFLNNGYYNNVSICASTWKKLVKLNKFKQQFIANNGRVPEKADYMKEEAFKGYSDDVLDKHIFFASNGYERSTEDLIGSHDNPDKVRTFGESLDQTNIYSEDEFIGLAEEVERKDLLENIYSRINNFDGIEKQVATCLYVENMSQRECAKQLHISSPTVANINDRIIATLRKDMALFD
jgi:RNA polymerase sigma factor (sigma-70 family)